jgi:hypothetical protein
MACKVCGCESTIRAHLIPKCFVNEVKTEKNQSGIIIDRNGKEYKRTPSGTFDSNLICAKCDSGLGTYENHVYDILKEIRSGKPPVGSVCRSNRMNQDLFIRFATGICWKFANTEPRLGKITVQSYESVLKNVAFHSESIPINLDLYCSFMRFPDCDVYWYQHPYTTRINGVNCIRFSVGSVIFILQVDRRCLVSRKQAEILSFRKAAQSHIPVIEYSAFEDWDQFRSSYSKSGSAKFFSSFKKIQT